MIDLGEYEQAFSKAHIALSLGREIGDRDTEAYALMLLGYVELAREKYIESQDLLQQSLDIYQELGQQKEVGKIWGVLGRVAYGLDDIPKVLQYLAGTLRFGLKIRVPGVLRIWAFPLIALLAADIGNYERAVELHTLTLQDPLALNSSMQKDVFGRHITAMTASLSPEELTEAQEQGKALNLWETAAELLAEIEEGKFSQVNAPLKD
jgi:tetratricopeptide (TPR) repeat protein